MVATSMNFMHIRSLIALARVCRRKIRRLKAAMNEEMNEAKKEKEGEERGDIDRTEEGLKRILKIYNEEIEDRRIIEEDEMTILFEEFKEIFNESEHIQNLVETLKKTHPDIARRIEHDEDDFKNTINEIKSHMKKIIQEEMDSIRDASGRLRYAHITTEHFLTGKAFQQALREMADIKKLENENHALSTVIVEIERLAKANDEKAAEKINNLLDKFEREIKEDEGLIKDLVMDIYELLHILHIVYFHLLSMLAKENPEGFYAKLQNLGKEGFPKNIIELIDTDYEKEAKKVVEDSKHIFEMARWLGYEIQAGMKQN